jgi:hypothetical protein
LDGGVAVRLRSQRVGLDVGMAGAAVGHSAACFLLLGTLSAPQRALRILNQS